MATRIPVDNRPSKAQTARLRTVRGMIDSAWGKDHFDLDVEQWGDLQGAFDSKETGCGAVGCVAGFLPLVNSRVTVQERGLFYLDSTYIGGYQAAAEHEEGFGLSSSEADNICNPEAYYGDGWTREEVLARIDEVLARQSP